MDAGAGVRVRESDLAMKEKPTEVSQSSTAHALPRTTSPSFGAHSDAKSEQALLDPSKKRILTSIELQWNHGALLLCTLDNGLAISI